MPSTDQHQNNAGFLILSRISESDWIDGRVTDSAWLSPPREEVSFSDTGPGSDTEAVPDMNHSLLSSIQGSVS